jgi:hypothetical protein
MDPPGADPPANRQALQLAYRATVDQLASAIGLADSRCRTPQAEGRAARLGGVAGEPLHGSAARRTGAVPAAARSLAGHLREEGSYKVNRAGLARAVELASAKWKADSAANAAGAGQGAIQPAPGGPPVGTDSGGKTR